jgi:hypothetical protein
MSEKKHLGVRKKPSMELKGHTNYIEALVALEKGFIASGSKDKTVRVWRTSDGKQVQSFDTISEVSCMCYLGSNLLAVGMEESHSVMIIDVEKGTSSLLNNAPARTPGDSVYSITLTEQPDHIAIVSDIEFDGMIRILNFRTGAIVQTFRGEFGDGFTVCSVKPNSIVFNSPHGHDGFGVITHTAGAYSPPVYRGDVKWTIMMPFDTDLMLGWCDHRIDHSFLNKVFLINIKTGVATLFYEIDKQYPITDKDVIDNYVIDICKLGNHHIAISSQIGVYIVKIKHTNEGTFKGERVAHYFMIIGVGGDLCAVEGGGLAVTGRRDIEIYKTHYANTTRRQAIRSIISRTNPNVAGHILSFLEGNSHPIKTKKASHVYERPAPHNSSGELDYVAGAKRFAERVSKPLRVIGEEGPNNGNNRNNAPPLISKINKIDLNLNRKGVPIDRKKYVQRHTFKRLSESLRQSRKRIFNSFASKLGVNELTESQKKLVENKMDNAFNRDVKVKSKNIVKLLTEPKPEPVAPVPKSKSRSKAALLARLNEPD